MSQFFYKWFYRKQYQRQDADCSRLTIHREVDMADTNQIVHELDGSQLVEIHEYPCSKALKREFVPSHFADFYFLAARPSALKCNSVSNRSYHSGAFINQINLTYPLSFPTAVGFVDCSGLTRLELGPVRRRFRSLPSAYIVLPGRTGNPHFVVPDQ